MRQANGEAFAKFRERGSALQAVKNLRKAGTMRWHSAVDHLSSSWRTPTLKEIDRQIRTRLTLAATHRQGLAKTWIWDMSLFREQFAILGQASRLRHGRFAGCSKRIAATTRVTITGSRTSGVAILWHRRTRNRTGRRARTGRKCGSRCAHRNVGCGKQCRVGAGRVLLALVAPTICDTESRSPRWRRLQRRAFAQISKW